MKIHSVGGLKMKIFVSLMILFSLFYTGMDFTASGEEEAVIEEIMAKVGGKIITRTEFNKRKEQVLVEMQEFMSEEEYGSNLDRVDERVLNDMIHEALVEQKAAEYAIAIPESAINEAIERLKEENNITTQEQFEQALESIGMTLDELQRNMRSRFLRNALLEQEVKSKIILSQIEVEKYYEEHKEDYRILPSIKIRQVFFPSDRMAREEILGEYSKIQQELQAGGTFEEIAARYAQTEDETDSGILGPFNKGDLLEKLEEAAFSLEIGQVSDVIETGFGFYMIQVVDRDAGGYKPISEVSEEIRDTIYRQMANEGIEEYLEQLKEEIFVEILSKG